MPRKPSPAVAQYLAALPADRRETIATVRDTIAKRLPKGYEESIEMGMITYSIPLSAYPDTYNGRPLCYAALASQKNHCSIYLMGAYADPAQARWLSTGFRKHGKKLDMGKSCVRFRTASDLALDVIGDAIARLTPDAFIELTEAARRRKKK